LKTKRNLLASTLLAGVAALGAPAGVALVTSLAPSAVLAQDFTAGILTGEVTDTEGNPIPGAQVTVRSNEQGFTRNVTTSEQGAFRVPTIPLGNYTVTIEAPGFQSMTNNEVRVRLGGSSAYNFTVLREGEVESTVVVAGRRPELDFTQTTTGLTIDLEELAKQLPIGRDITSVTLLAPQTIEGDPGIGGQSLPSIAGSSLAENAFYINGLNITNFDTYVGASAVPFDFYRTVEVKTGGYHAEFGRATGGVINAVSKSGSNEFEFAIHGNYNLASLREQQPATFQAANARDYDQTLSTSIEAGGPIIRDRLFFYGLVEFREQENRFASITGGSYNIDTSDDPFYGFKLDGYITDDHRLEFTWFDTTVKPAGGLLVQRHHRRGRDHGLLADEVRTGRRELGGPLHRRVHRLADDLGRLRPGERPEQHPAGEHHQPAGARRPQRDLDRDRQPGRGDLRREHDLS
jgi:hypothetical protein